MRVNETTPTRPVGRNGNLLLGSIELKAELEPKNWQFDSIGLINRMIRQAPALTDPTTATDPIILQFKLNAGINQTHLLTESRPSSMLPPTWKINNRADSNNQFKVFQTHTHTHTHKEREREWRGKNRCLLQLLNSISKLGTGSMKTWGDYIKARLQFANWRCTTSWWQIQVGWRGVRGRNPHFLPPLLSPFLPLPPGAPSLHTRVLLMTHAPLRKAPGEG